MSTHTAVIAPEPAVTPMVPFRNPAAFDHLVREARDEFLEMPNLSLTLAQAARLFGTDLRQAKQLLHALLDEGFLVRDARGAYLRRDSSYAARAATTAKQPREAAANVDRLPTGDRSTAAPAPPESDLLESIGVELPCMGCGETYRVSLRSIRLSQMMMVAGCQVRHFADCPPAGFANLIDPALLAEFEQVVERIELAAEGAGGRVVGPQ